MLRGRTLPLALAALAVALALLQRPGLAVTDTKIDLHVDPAGFLSDVASAWSPTGDLGHVQGGQYSGYLFPMGPFFALGHLAGLGPWLVQRLWFALVLALAAWGAVRLMDELAGRPRGLIHAVTGLFYLLNPYVVIFTARTTVTLLAYAALPWLLVCVLRGSDPLRRRWRWAAAFALIVTASGGGVNAAVTVWVLLGPVLLGLYVVWTGRAAWRDVGGFAWRAGLATVLASAWWVIPLLVQSRFGVDFLRFTEQPGTIWNTTSLNESLRLMGYWVSYLGVGYGGELHPYFSDGGVLIFALPVVLAGTLVPALALLGFAWTRNHAFAAFALLLVVVGLVVMTAGFPEGTPLRKASNFTYNHLVVVQFLRTTHKAAPLVALGIAILAGLWATPTRAVVFAALAAVACWPLVRGQATDSQVSWERIPAAWQAAAEHLDRAPGDGRAVVLPGQLYAYYDWGGTIDPILPTLADRPVALRNAVGYADLRATDLLWTTDALVEQRRALPGQLDPLLNLLGARTVLSGADDDRTRSGAATAADAADVLDQLGSAGNTWGPPTEHPRAAGTLGGPRLLPELRAWDRPQAPGLVRVEPAEPQTVVDGSADGVAALAAFQDPGAGLAYAADLQAAEIRKAREVVITDSNRRRVFVVSRLAQNTGATLAADEQPSVDAAVLDPFAKGSDAQTVAVYDGIAAVRAPSSPGYSQFPDRRPFAALDGDTATHWQADRALAPERYTLTVTFDAPRDVDHVDLLPYDDRKAKVTAVEIAGRRHAIRPGWNRVPIGLHDAASLTIRIIGSQAPGPRVTAGIRELRVPGLAADEALRPPVLAERALAGHDTGTGLTYLFQRTTGDDPFRRDPRRGSAAAALVRDRLDGERGLERVFSPPAARTWDLDGWATAAPDASDEALDALAGVDGRFTSSGRFQGRPGFRASSAFDGTSQPWIGSWLDGRTAWLDWTTPRDTEVRSLTLEPVPGVRHPTQVRLNGSPPVDVGPDGTVTLPQPVRDRRFRLEILRAAFVPGTPGTERQRRAVGIAEVRGDGPRIAVPRRGPLSRDCVLTGTISGRSVRLRAAGTIEELDAGAPLRVTGCEPVGLPAGAARLSMPPAALAPYLIRLRSPGSRPPAPSPGRVIDAGTPDRSGGRRGIRLALEAPARLVLAESYNRGRRASCDGRDLGEPEVGAAFGTAWRVPAGCRTVKISFAPNRLVIAGYAISLLSVLVLVLLVLRRDGAGAPAAAPPPERRPQRVPAGRAGLVAIPAGLALGFVFAARASPLFALGVFVVLWRGIGARQLALAGGAVLTVAVPALTLLIRPENRGGYNPEYALERIAVHWVAVAGFALLILALIRELARLRAPSPGGGSARAARSRARRARRSPA